MRLFEPASAYDLHGYDASIFGKIKTNSFRLKTFREYDAQPKRIM